MDMLGLMESVGLLEIFVILFATIATWVLPAVVFWKICHKAGFPGSLALFMLVPIANIILPVYIAFAGWPVLRRLKELEGRD